ncbi:MAG TPA: hypothetical protein VGI88_16165 [Verrucomicrobiae bacterium]
MFLRQIRCVIALALFAALFAGCGKSATAPPKPAVSSPAPLETIARIHWLGKNRISADTNAATFMKIWDLPESVKLEAQTLDKLSVAPWRFLHGETNHSTTNLLRPLLDDLANEESYVEIRRATNSTNAADEIVLAIRLNNQRAALWQTNLAAVVESLTGMTAANSQPSGTNTAPGWSLRKHHAPNLIELTRAGDWTLVGAAQDHNALLDETLARIGHEGVPFPIEVTNSWLEAGGDLSRLASAMGFADNKSSNFPQVYFTVLGSAQYVLTHGEITLPGKAYVKLDPWNIPTNLIDGDLTSFTAIRGFKPWLSSSKTWTNLQIGPPPDQFYIWAVRAFPMETYFAAPLSDASNAVSRFSDLVLKKGSPWFATNSLAGFRRSATFNGLSWHGLPYAAPFLQSIDGKGGAFVFGGYFQPTASSQPPPPALLKEILNHTNLVYYDWELTGLRVDQWLHLGQFIRFVSGKAQLPFDSATTAWIRAVSSQLGNCGTEITETEPGQLSFTRNSTVGLTAIELHLLADWLESPNFPYGLHTLLAPPSEQ